MDNYKKYTFERLCWDCCFSIIFIFLLPLNFFSIEEEKKYLLGLFSMKRIIYVSFFQYMFRSKKYLIAFVFCSIPFALLTYSFQKNAWVVRCNTYLQQFVQNLLTIFDFLIRIPFKCFSFNHIEGSSSIMKLGISYYIIIITELSWIMYVVFKYFRPQYFKKTDNSNDPKMKLVEIRSRDEEEIDSEHF